MSNFVDDNTDLPYPKHYLRSAPSGKEHQYIQAKDWNALCQAVVDLRTFVLSIPDLSNHTITAGTGLTGGGSLSSNLTINLANTTVTPGSYTSADITVDAQGRITSASNGVSGGGVTADGTTITGNGTVGSPLIVVDKTNYINVKNFGAVGDGVTDDRAAILLAEAAGIAANGRFVLFFPPGEYVISRTSTLAYSWNLASSNCTLLGVKGKSWLKHPPGMPNASVTLLRVDRKQNVTIRDLGFDGNWGNAVTTIASASNNVVLPQATINVEDTTGFPSSGTIKVVLSTGPQTITYTGKTSTSFTGCSGGTGTLFVGRKIGYIDTNTGINHTSQTDPKNYLLMIRGASDMLVDNCLFRQSYGDMIWCGYSSADGNTWAKNIHIRDCVGNISARDGIAIGQAVDGIYVNNCQFRNIKAQAFDTEPVDQPARNVYVQRCLFDTWWNPSTSTVNAPVSITGGTSLKPGPHAFARNYRFTDNVVNGSIIIQMAEDVEFRSNSIICDYQASSYAPILVQMYCDGVRVIDNFIYDRTSDATGGQSHKGSIHMEVYSNVKYNGQPSGVVIRGNRIVTRNGHAGIFLNGVGGGSYDTAISVADYTGTASDLTGTTLVDASAAWTADQWSGWMVRRGTGWATILSNTATTLTLDTPTFFGSAWIDYRGSPLDIPAIGTYQITTARQISTVEGNDIDCSDDGYGAGGVGIWLAGGRPGGRISCRNNRIRNATGDGIFIQGATPPDRFMPWVEVVDNKAFDDQVIPTCTNTIRFSNAQLITRLILRGNSKGDGVTNAVSGLTTGVWLMHDGMVQEWAGYGTPESVVTAPVGSTFRRLDGSAGIVFYVKNSGTGSTGWVSTGGVAATGTIVCVAKASIVDGETVTISDGLGPAKVYEFDTNSTVTAGNIQVNITSDTTATTVANRLKNAIEANQPVISVVNSVGTLVLTHKIAGTFANVNITKTVANAGFTVTGMANGANPAR